MLFSQVIAHKMLIQENQGTHLCYTERIGRKMCF
jgi:hypothetical protein